METTEVLCPSCNARMVLRKGSRGDFYGCGKYPMCRGTRDVNGKSTTRESSATPIKLADGSHEQEAIWDYQLEGRGNVVISAGPGTGKTWTEIQYCLRADKALDILFVAFNSHIAKEANDKLIASRITNVRARTFHGLGRWILVQNFKSLAGVEPNEKKMRDIFEQLNPMPLMNKGIWRRRIMLAETLAGHAKNFLIDHKSPTFVSEMENLADHFAIDVDDHFHDALGLVPEALDECVKRADSSFDFDDMIWLPLVLGLKPKYPADQIITDESQDLNTPQHALTFVACPTGRIFVVGDRHQAIYGFRGARTASIDDLKTKLAESRRGVKEFPLTITRRCPKLHVAMAKMLYPEIQALDDAPLGVIESTPYERAIHQMKPGDLVLCRINRPLIATAYDLIKRKIRPIVKGRDIGKGLLALIDHLVNDLYVPIGDGRESANMTYALRVYRMEHEARLAPLGEDARFKLAALADKCDCLSEFITHSNTVEEMRTKIVELFSDMNDGAPPNAVVLGTVHRTKGLEAERVFVLLPELIGFTGWCKKEWEVEQEINLAWVAVTRAKFDNAKGEPGTIIFCGAVPPIFSAPRPLKFVETETIPDEVPEGHMTDEELASVKKEEERVAKLAEKGIDAYNEEVPPAEPLRKKAEKATRSVKKLEKHFDEKETKLYGTTWIDQDEPPF